MRLACLLACAAGLAGPAAQAAVIAVPPGDGLQAVIDGAAPGDTLRLAAGVHAGHVVIATPGLVLEGEPGAAIQSDGQGRTLWVRAPDVTIRGLEVRGSGLDLFAMDAAVFLDKTADRAVVEDCRFSGALIAVYLWGPHDAHVRRNRVDGLTDQRVSERGAAFTVWNSPGSEIVGNAVVDGRDGVFSVSSRKNTISGNSFRGVRFAVHFMYTNDSTVAGNVSVGNDVGYVLMYSDRLAVRDNVSDRDHDHGLLFNFANSSRVEGNVVRNSEKCVFIYNANKNVFRNNWFEGCQIGVHFTAGSERNEIAGNAFVGNRTQVMYVGTRFLDWSFAGRGNYWSDHAAFDLDGRGVAATPYRPNDVMDQVMWRAPAAKLLVSSPAVQMVRWAQAQFPAIHPGGVVDTAPLMTPPRPAALARLDAAGTDAAP